MSILSFFRSQKNNGSKKHAGNNQKCVANSRVTKEILCINHNFLPFSVNQKLTNKPSIPNGKFLVNKIRYSLILETPKKPGTMNITPNQPEVKLTQIPAITSKIVFLGIFTNLNIAHFYETGQIESLYTAEGGVVRYGPSSGTP